MLTRRMEVARRDSDGSDTSHDEHRKQQPPPVFQKALVGTHGLWLHQAQNDPSITSLQVEIWANKLEKELKQAVTRYDYVKLFGDLLGEWLKSGDSLAVSQEPSEASSTEESAHVKGMRKERSAQQDRIQELIFDPKHMDVIAIEDYLEDVFSEPDAHIELTKLRTR
ncbi:hypothetical protein BDZ89DRAFT_551796 [Hymenopellis radicata]|nr:hypothetical protein BDZ89DRAFT_551796 [Hymenopellis radicata]